MSIIEFPDREYLLNEAHALYLCMVAPSEEAPNAPDYRAEIIAVVQAWLRGELLPKNKAPLLVSLHNEIEYEGIRE